MKAAIWARVSTEEQELANQLLQLKEYAARRDLDVVTVYEVTESGWKGAHLAQFNQLAGCG